MARDNPHWHAPSIEDVTRRAEELDALDAILPYGRRDQLAALLTDDDVSTLKHLAAEGMGENTLRALTSDLAYLKAWSLAATGKSLPWPAPESMLLKFVAHHLWDQGFLRTAGPHAPDTVRRRLASWSTLTKWRGLAGAFASPALKSAIRLAVRATPRPRKRKSAKAVTGDVLAQMLATCSTRSLRDIRDRAILMVAFASRSRRRSEIAGLRVEQITVEPPIETDSCPPLPRHSSWPYQNVRRRPGRSCLSHRSAGRGAQRLDRRGKDRKWQRVSEGRSLGRCVEAGAGAGSGQCDRQAAGGDGRIRQWRVFCARASVGIFD